MKKRVCECEREQEREEEKGGRGREVKLEKKTCEEFRQMSDGKIISCSV